MPSDLEVATVVVRMSVAGEDRLVLARITARRDGRQLEVRGPMLATADDLVARVSEVVAELARDIVASR